MWVVVIMVETDRKFSICRCKHRCRWGTELAHRLNISLLFLKDGRAYKQKHCRYRGWPAQAERPLPNLLDVKKCKAQSEGVTQYYHDLLPAASLRLNEYTLTLNATP